MSIFEEKSENQRSYDNDGKSKSGKSGKGDRVWEYWMNPVFFKEFQGRRKPFALNRGVPLDSIADMTVRHSSTAEWRLHAKFANEERDELLDLAKTLGPGESLLHRWHGAVYELKRNPSKEAPDVSQDDSEGWESVDVNDISDDELAAMNAERAAARQPIAAE